MHVCMYVCVCVYVSSHATDHGNTFLPNASFYLRTSSPLALDGNGATGAHTVLE